MKVVVAGRFYDLKDLGDENINNAFIALFEGFFHRPMYNWQIFEKEASDFLSRIHGVNRPGKQHDEFFQNIMTLRGRLIELGMSDSGAKLIDNALKIAQEWESTNPGKFVHKGTPYYFKAGDCIARGDLDSGYLYMHKALEEDRRTVPQDYHTLPAHKFCALDFGTPDQALWPLLDRQVEYLKKRIEDYCSTYGNLKYDIFEGHFLNNRAEIKPDTLFWFSYTIARLLHLEDISRKDMESDFASQLEMDILFAITRLTEMTMKPKYKGGKTNKVYYADYLIDLLEQLTESLPTNCTFQGVYEEFKNDSDAAVEALLNGSAYGNITKGLSEKQRDCLLSHAMRNHVAHGFLSVQIIAKQFEKIRERLFNVLFLIVEKLYANP